MVWVPDNPFVSVVGTLVIWLIVGVWIYVSIKKKKTKGDDE